MNTAIINKKTVSICAAALLIIVCAFLPNPDGLTQEAKMAVVLLFAGLILWISQAIPSGISALVLMALMPYFGIFSFSELWAKFMSSAWFFVMVSFALSAGLSRTSIPLRANVLLLRLVGAHTERVLLGFMIIAAVLSMLCANIATVAMMIGFVVEMLKANGAVPKQSRLGKAMVLSVVYGALIGGCTTLSGSSSHVMLLSMTEQYFNFSVRFVDWLIISAPILIVLLPATWFTLIKLYKPEPISQEVVDKMIASVHDQGKMSGRDKAFGIFLLAVFACWMASSWVPILNLTTTSLFALGIMFLPGVNFIDWDGFVKGVSWNVLLVVGGVIALTAGIQATGGMAWFVAMVAPFFQEQGEFFTYLFSSTFCCIAHCIVPSGSATAGICAIPMMELARVTGANPTAIFHIIGWWAGTTFLMPVDSIMLLAYSYGYTEMKDPIKAGIIPTLLLILLSATVTPWMCTTFNIGDPLV